MGPGLCISSKLPSDVTLLVCGPHAGSELWGLASEVPAGCVREGVGAQEATEESKQCSLQL